MATKELAFNAEVNFHEQELVSIYHESNVSGIEEQFAELAFAAAFAIRMMSNLGMHEVTDALAAHLRLAASMMLDTPTDVLIPKPRIVPYPGTPGRKRFLSKLRFSDERMHLDFAAKGFGWLARGVGYYGPAAVQTLFRYFASRRMDDARYLSALANVAAGCAQLQAGRQIQVTNHVQLEMMLVVTCMEDYMPSWLR